MTDLPGEVELARALLTRVAAEPGVQARIYRRIVATRRVHATWRMGLVIPSVAVLLAASAALGFGLASRLEYPLRVAETVAPGHGAPRPIPRRTKAPADSPKEDPVLDNRRIEAPIASHVDVREAESEGGVVLRLPVVAKSAATIPNSAEPVSVLGLQVTEYRMAVAELAKDPVAALEMFRAHGRKWPQSAIRHEVDLRIVQALVSLGRSREAQSAAEKFLERYPESPRAAEVRSIAASSQFGDGGVD